VNVNGVIWAPVNCGYHATDYKYGKLYQWGRKYGQGYYGQFYEGDWNQIYSDALVPEEQYGPVALSTGQSASYSDYYLSNYESPNDWVTPQDDNLWKLSNYGFISKTEYDPCPDGWRVPTYSELNNLISITSLWTNNEGQYGRWFTGEDSYSIFFPASGIIFCGDGVARLRGSEGAYWSSEPCDNKAYAFCFSEQGMNISIDNTNSISWNSRANGFSVRCVQLQQ
jgi:uncharacterized protein (TIGR02145 family)